MKFKMVISSTLDSLCSLEGNRGQGNKVIRDIRNAGMVNLCWYWNIFPFPLIPLKNVGWGRKLNLHFYSHVILKRWSMRLTLIATVQNLYTGLSFFSCPW